MSRRGFIVRDEFSSSAADYAIPLTRQRYIERLQSSIQKCIERTKIKRYREERRGKEERCYRTGERKPRAHLSFRSSGGGTKKQRPSKTT